MLSKSFSVYFYPDWVRGPGDHSYHYHIESEFGFKTLAAAKKHAEKILRHQNAEHPGSEWRAEIYQQHEHHTRRSMYGNQIGRLVKWRRAR